MEAVRDGVQVIVEAVGLLGGILSFLGVTGLVLFVLSLILLALLGAFSPLPRMANYIAVVGLVTGLTLFGIDGFGDLPERADAVRRYLVVMLSPLVLVVLVRWVWRTVFRGRSETEQLRDAITALTEEVTALRRDRRGERALAEPPLELRAKSPRRLLPLPRPRK